MYYDGNIHMLLLAFILSIEMIKITDNNNLLCLLFTGFMCSFIQFSSKHLDTFIGHEQAIVTNPCWLLLFYIYLYAILHFTSSFPTYGKPKMAVSMIILTNIAILVVSILLIYIITK